MLIARVGMHPSRAAVDGERTLVEDFREAGAHVHLGRGRQAIAAGPRRRVAHFVLQQALLLLATRRRGRRRSVRQFEITDSRESHFLFLFFVAVIQVRTCAHGETSSAVASVRLYVVRQVLR